MVRRSDNARLSKLTSLYRKSPKYFKKLFIIYFALIVIIFAIITGLVTVYKKSDDGYNAFMEKTVQTEKFKTDTDIIFDTADVIVNLLSQYDITKTYAGAVTDDYSRLDFGLMHSIVKNVSLLQTRFAGYNLNIAMTKYNDNRVFTGNGTIESVDSFFEESGIDIHNAVYKMEEQGDEAEYTLLKDEGLKDEITVIHRRIISGSKMYYILFFGNEDMKYMYDKEVDCHFIYSGYIEKFKDTVKERILETGEIKALEYISTEGGVDCFYSASGFEDDRIVYVKCFRSENSSALLLIIPWLVIFTALAAVFALLLAKYSYIPMHKVLERFGVIGGDNMDEFAAMEEMVDSMLETNRSMHISIEKKDKILKNRFMSDVLNGYIWGEKLAEMAREMGLEFITDECYLILMEPWGMSAEDNMVLDSVSGVEAKVFNAVEEHFADFPDTVFCVASDRRMVIVSSKESNDLAGIMQEIDIIRCETGLGINIAVGETGDDEESISKLCRTLVRGLDNKSLTSKKDIITVGDISNLTNSKLIYSTETEAMLIEYVVNGENAKSLYCLNNIFKSNKEAFDEQLEDFRLTMIITVKRILAKLDAGESDVFGYRISISDEINNAKSADELFNTVKDMFGIISDYVSDSIDTSTLTVGSEILEYIDANLGADISISDVSEHFGISPSSIGRILRMQYNVTFKTYINDARIKKAKRIMDENKNVLIKDLARMCGYNNAVSFIRMFKKSEGVSPGQYVKMK